MKNPQNFYCIAFYKDYLITEEYFSYNPKHWSNLSINLFLEGRNNITKNLKQFHKDFETQYSDKLIKNYPELYREYIKIGCQ